MGNQVVIPSFKDWYTSPLRKRYRDIIFINPLDSGSFFMIFEGEVKKTGKKVLIKAYEYDRPLSMLPQIKESLQIFERLAKDETVHGVMGYSRYFVQDNMAFLVRPMLDNCLYDMIVFPQPRLERFEKLWICFQVAQSMLSLDAAGMTHGDIKPNNIYVLGNLETVLLDIAPFKPRWIDSDRPHLFYHFFSSNVAAGYYMAPERLFVRYGEGSSVDMAAADIFSFGCVMAFVFLDGEDLFDMTKIRDYWDGKFDLRKALEKIEDPTVIDWIMMLLSLDVSERKTMFFYVLGQFPRSFQELYVGLFKPTQDSIETEIEKIEKLAAVTEPEASIILFSYAVDKLLKVNTMREYLMVINFLRDFAKRLSDHGKATHGVPVLMEFLNVNSIAVKRSALYAMIDVIADIKQIPKAVTGLFQYSIQPRLQKLTNLSNESEETLLLAEILPYLAWEVRRLDPDSLGSLCIAFGNISATVYPSVYSAFSQSMRSIAHKVDFEFFDTFFAFILAPANLPDERFKTEWCMTLHEFCNHCWGKEQRLFRNKSYNALMPVLSDMISRKESNERILPKLLYCYQLLLERDLLPAQASYAIIQQVLPHLKHDSVKVRYAAAGVISALTPMSKQAPLLTFMCEKSPSFPSVVDEKGFRRKPQAEQKPLLPPPTMVLAPRFVSAFHKRTLPITHIVAGSSGIQKFYAIENSRKIRQMSLPTAENPLMDEFDTYVVQSPVRCATTFDGSGAFLLGYECGDVDMFSEIDISRRHTLFSHHEQLPVTTLLTADNLCLAGFRNGSVMAFDARACTANSINLGFNGLISSCKWPQYFVGFGFDGGTVSIFDLRMMLPITTGLTNTPRQMVPIPSESSSIGIATSYGTRLDFFEKSLSDRTFRNTLAMQVPSMRILPMLSGVLMIDQMSASYVTSTSASKLYDRKVVEEPLPTHALTIPFSATGMSGNFSSIHGHNYNILAASVCQSMVISGDDCGFISAYQVCEAPSSSVCSDS